MIDFQTIDDFVVRLVDSGETGKHVELGSVSLGRLAGFPAWDHADRDLRHFIESDIPLGTREQPYEDSDEGWRIAIFEHGGWVYIAQAEGETASAFRVETERYRAVWRALIDRFNPAMGLDDLFPSEVQ
jgi:hypothetical protein